MGSNTVFAEISRILYLLVMKFTHVFYNLLIMEKEADILSIPAFFWYLYLTAPVIPSAKLFWKKKKMTTVGIVQISTPSISIP